MMQTRVRAVPNAHSEQRASLRHGCDIAVRGKGQTEIGTITNIALDGCFVSTNSRFDPEIAQRLAFSAEGFGRVIAEAEVVRSSPSGVGVRFTHVPTAGRRRLRRLVAELNAIESHRYEAATLHGETSLIHTINDPERIASILEEARTSQSKFTLIPSNRNEREAARVISRADHLLMLEHEDPTGLAKHEEASVLFTLGFNSYSFRARVREAHGKHVKLGLPDLLSYSERRSVTREKPKPGAMLALQVPWQRERAEWPVYDMSSGGFSIRVPSGNALFLPGTPLEGAILRTRDEITPLPKAVVRHVTHFEEDDGHEWWKVGVSRGVERTETPVIRESVTPPRPGILGALMKWLRRLVDTIAYVYHTRSTKLIPDESHEPFQVISLKNDDGRELVGLLNFSFPARNRVRAPLVIVVPAFGSRKENAAALALTITHNFKRHNKDIAVLRFDGVNNMGESERDPGLNQEGKHTHQFTVGDGVSDLVGALAWARNNPHVDATDIIVVSMSFSSIAVRVALNRPEAKGVGRWIVYMGAADAQNSIMNVSGNFDAWGNYVRGIKNGIVTLNGCMVDGDRFCSDIDRLSAATLEDARRDFASLDVPITWIVGKHDAWMDPERIHDIMTVKAPREREIIEVDTGHIPTSGDEALAQFQLMTRLIWTHLFDEGITAVPPPRGWLAAIARQEWNRVRGDSAVHSEEYWHSYLLGHGERGYDLFRLLPAYREFAAIQALEARVEGADVLDLGAGTGIVSDAILREQPNKLTCVDIVQTALERLRENLGDAQEVEIMQVNVDGCPATAVRRWVKGETPSIRELAGRIPGVSHAFTELVAPRMTGDVHALLRGADMNPKDVRREAGLAESTEALLHDLNVLAKVERGHITTDKAKESLRRVPQDVLQGNSGLPFADSSYDAVMASLLLSYLEHPEDCLSECLRVLRPGGRLVVSSMKPDADTSIIYREFLDMLEAASDDELPADRTELIAAARGLLNKAAEVIRHEKEGLFRFYDAGELADLVRRAGFTRVTVRRAYGSPPQAIIVSCRKPRIAG